MTLAQRAEAIATEACEGRWSPSQIEYAILSLIEDAVKAAREEFIEDTRDLLTRMEDR